VHFCYDRRVSGVVKKGDVFTIRAAKNTISAKKAILATGGISYPQTGSTGNGYKFAQHFGHTIIQPRAALVPLVTQESWPSELAGTTIENVRIHSAAAGRKCEATGPLLFTDDGIAGPAVLDMSRFLTDCLPAKNKPIQLSVDMTADISATLFESRLLEQISANPRKTIANILSAFFPRCLAAVVCQQIDCDGTLSANQVSKDIRKELVRFLKAVPLSITGTRPIEEATVTRGGVSTDDIDPKTMQSKICPGLFFAGEVIDIDGPCGGYNLQICWSTGALAGRTLTS
jgi:predicted Rossmann fold flavoprotein